MLQKNNENFVHCRSSIGFLTSTIFKTSGAQNNSFHFIFSLHSIFSEKYACVREKVKIRK